MSQVFKALAKGLFMLLLLFVLMFAAIFAWGRLRPATAAQRDALALMHQTAPPLQGRNAFVLLWLGNNDVPDEQLESVYTDERQRMQAWVDAHHGELVWTMPPPHPPFPALAPVTEKALLCVNGDQCLDRVRSHPEQTRVALAAHAQRLARDRALTQRAYYRTDIPAAVFPVAIPSFVASMGLWSSAIALDFIDGKQTQAMQEGCLQVLTMRRLHAHSDNLVSTMVFGARLTHSIQLTMQMLSELPADEPEPAVCGEAFAPLTVADVDLCPALRGEFHYALGAESMEAHLHWYNRWEYSRAITERLMATHQAAICSETTHAHQLADESLPPHDIALAGDVFDYGANVVGTTLLNVASPTYANLLNRQEDIGATLRLGATALWLRETRGQGALKDRLAQRPAWMQLAGDRQLQLSDHGRSLSVQAHDQSDRNWEASWPLPAGL